MKDYILGLDLGTASIGWAIVECDAKGKPAGLNACGARIFEEVVDLKSRVPKNRARRDARQARKLLARRKMRRTTLLNLLVANGLLPKDDKERAVLFADNKQFDPYALRKRALDEKLSPFEFGRAIYHLNQRRGFQSNRKAGDKKEEGEVKTAINTLRANMEEAKSRTLGEFLASQNKKRERYTDREMYKEEFEKIWSAQQKHHEKLRDTSFKVKVHKAMFFQRPLKVQKYLVGKCTFEPRRKRASRATLEYQRFRILQDINHLEIKDPITRDFRPLTGDEREVLIKLLGKQKTLSFDAAKKKLKLHEGETFNLEEGKREKLLGDAASYTLRKILGGRWDDMGGDDKNSLITDILTIENESGFLRRMKEHWGFDDETAEELAKTELEQGYGRLSLKALGRIIPHLEKGMTYDKACEAAGYKHTGDDNRNTVDALPAPPYLRNPVVQKAMFETRKLVNAVIRKYGKPSVIRIEMARDMKLTKKQKDTLNKTQKENEERNSKATKILQEDFGIQNPSHEDILKYKLWEECRHICPYTGKTISREMLFSSEVEIEHILPWSRSIDDSYMNKTLCMSSENKTKHNKTPLEAYSGNQEKYLEILARCKTMPWPKRRRLEQKEIDTDKCVERQLNDTRYISREVKGYVAGLGARVEVTKGEATGALRYKWGLNSVLDETGTHKNRDDHRHHAVDAIVVALTSRGLFQALSRMSAQSGVSLSQRGFALREPWANFYTNVKEKVDAIIVSHAPSHAISGALHEETAYGYSEAEGCYIYRKPLETLTAAEVEKIRDAKIKELVEARLKEFDGDGKKAFGDKDRPLLHVDGKTPIRSVRLKVNLNPVTVYGVKSESGEPYKYFKYGNNHHVEIIENVKTGKRKGVFVTAMEAARRARSRDKTAIIQRDHGPEWKFIMWLCVNDMMEIEQGGNKLYYRVQLLDASNENIALRLGAAATLDDKSTRLFARHSKLKGRKITVDPLGSIRYVND